LLLRCDCVSHGLRLLLLRANLDSLHGCNCLPLLLLVLRFNLEHSVFDELQQLIVRHA
jgi:hypothetical protein